MARFACYRIQDLEMINRDTRSSINSSSWNSIMCDHLMEFGTLVSCFARGSSATQRSLHLTSWNGGRARNRAPTSASRRASISTYLDYGVMCEPAARLLRFAISARNRNPARRPLSSVLFRSRASTCPIPCDIILKCGREILPNFAASFTTLEFLKGFGIKNTCNATVIRVVEPTFSFLLFFHSTWIKRFQVW